jgi:serine/threonine-protein kinase PknG
MERCAHAGCQGAVEEGYCTACGLAPSRVSPPRPGPDPVVTAAVVARPTLSIRGSNRSASRRLGAPMLARPPLPRRDPLAALVPFEVPARRRVCSSCEQPLSREAGFCPRCGQEYSFVPTLSPGDRVAEKYEIKGTVAFGGLGWIYLALDTVLGRWVILKGLLDAKDPKMLEVAVQEREYLAAVKHPNIVGIHDFVTGGRDSHEGFIVLEYVNGKTLMTLRKEAGGPLPPAQACAYICEILPALGYLDDLGLVYCDFKPENVMVEDETVKLIDLGAVRPAGATDGDVYGSLGYIAPEAHEAPTSRSDLYSVGRALAVLVASFDFQGRYEGSLPPPSEVPLFAQEDALHRFLLKATRANPDERFQSAAEMRGQLLGVMRGLVSKDERGIGVRVESALFEGDDERAGRADGFPRVRVDRDDEGAAIVQAAAALGDAERRRSMFARAVVEMPASMELKLRLLDELVTLARFALAEDLLATLEATDPADWRVGWYRGRMRFVEKRTAEALADFERLAAELPGELAPRHVLGLIHEREGGGGDLAAAVACFERVSRADASFASASLGLGRCRERQKDRAGAIEAYRRVPSTSHRYVAAQLALATLLLSDLGGTPTRADLEHAGEAAAALDPLADGLAKHELRATIFATAAKVRGETRGEAILGVPWEPRALRRAAEHELRTCARFVDGDRKIELVDRANAVRPLTWT